MSRDSFANPNHVAENSASARAGGAGPGDERAHVLEARACARGSARFQAVRVIRVRDRGGRRRGDASDRE